MRYRKLQKVLVLLAFILGLFGLGLSSCHKENQELVLVKQENRLKAQSFKSPKLSDTEIIQKAQKYYKDFYGSELRGSQAPKVKKIIRSSKQSKFRSLTADNLSQSQLLIVNFEEEKGFVLMSENRYGTPLFGVSNKGNVSLDKPTNTGLDIIIHNAIVITQMENKTCPKCGGPYSTSLKPVIPEPNPNPNNPFIDGSNPKGNGIIQRGPVCTPFICLNDKPNDGTFPGFKPDDDGKIKFEDRLDTIWRKIETESKSQIPVLVVDTLLSKVVRWGQGSPYNDRVPLDEKGRECPISCVSIALGQIMAYHKYPNYNWDIIYQGDTSNTYFREVVPEFLYELGKKEYLDVDYNYDGSGALSDSVPTTLKKFGFTSSKLIPYNHQEVISNIRAGLPLYIRGKDTRVISKGDTTYKNGHAWVLDGLEEAVIIDSIWEVYKIRSLIDGEYLERKLIDLKRTSKFAPHCNFGYGGKYNGHYDPNLFMLDTFSTRRRFENDTLTEETPLFFRYSLDIIKDIKR